MLKKKKRIPICDHCQKLVDGSDLLYIARGEVWRAAGMTGWLGWLHLPCMEERLGRKAEIEKDLLVWVDEKSMVKACKEYLISPEFLHHSGFR